MGERRTSADVRKWRYVVAGLVGAAIFSGIGAIINLDTLHEDQQISQDAESNGDPYFQGESQQRVKDDKSHLQWEATGAAVTGTLAVAAYLIGGRKPEEFT